MVGRDAASRTGGDLQSRIVTGFCFDPQAAAATHSGLAKLQRAQQWPWNNTGDLDAQAAESQLLLDEDAEIVAECKAGGKRGGAAHIAQVLHDLADGEKPSGLHAGGNFSLPVDLLERAGGFDHRLPGSDHVDLGFRLNQMGALFLYQPRAHVVRHSHVDYAKWQLRHGLQGRLDVALFRDRGYGGGLLSMVACFHDRNPMNRAVIRLALSSAMAERGLVGLAGTLGDLALRFGLRRISLASMSVAANVLYWRGVRDGVRGNARFWQLVRVTRRRAGRTYERVSGATT